MSVSLCRQSVGRRRSGPARGSGLRRPAQAHLAQAQLVALRKLGVEWA
ncbi:hypothetical protein [Streptomyces sp. NBC_01363]|nr:hypothetical protein [Streptomyces sp. NBC_01363]MCX4736922.1 hypothetical protein [Streptomyces sp. NBC_01363]